MPQCAGVPWGTASAGVFMLVVQEGQVMPNGLSCLGFSVPN